MRRICIMNQKGGVGKTTTALGLAAALARLGQNVLLLDLDPQAHLTCSLGLEPEADSRGVLALLQNGLPPRQAAQPVADGLSLVPASLSLALAETELAARPGGIGRLREAFGQDGEAYDFAIADCPPNLGPLSLNALAWARELIIPMQAEFLALQSLGQILQTVERVQREVNPELRVTGIVLTRFTRQKKLGREVAQKIREYFGDKLFDTRIRENVALAEAPGFGRDIFRYRPASNGARDYLALGREVLKRAGATAAGGSHE